jgi:hypothetical protein
MICYVFRVGKSYKSRIYGSYLVELIVMLFPRIVDIYNFEVIMKQLTPYDAAALYCRLGYLQLFNPMKPEGFWELTFSRYEERQVLKILIGLSTVEPGDNWPYKSFKWNKEPGTVEVPAWELTIGYTIDKTCTTKGYLLVEYYSGEGLKLNGCKPSIAYRKALMQLCLIDELDMYDYENVPSELQDDNINFGTINGEDSELGNFEKVPEQLDDIASRPGTAGTEGAEEQAAPIDQTTGITEDPQAQSATSTSASAASSPDSPMSKPITKVVMEEVEEEKTSTGVRPSRVGDALILRSIKVEYSISQWILYYAPPDGSIRDIPGRELPPT